MADLRDNVDQWRKPASGGGAAWARRVAVVAAIVCAAGALMAASGALVIPGCDQDKGLASGGGGGLSAVSQEKNGNKGVKDGASAVKKDGGKDGSKQPDAGGVGPEYLTVPISGKDFKLELALNDQVRFKGLSDRKEIPADEGMLFVFPFPRKLDFVMRDCPIPIDIIFLDGSGRVTAFHKMVAEEARRDDEPKNDKDPSLDKYESRLKRYGSRYSAQFVIELKGDTLDSLKLHEGDQIKLDAIALKKRAK